MSSNPSNHKGLAFSIDKKRYWIIGNSQLGTDPRLEFGVSYFYYIHIKLTKETLK